jgi:glutamate synthase (ferredoxin)
MSVRLPTVRLRRPFTVRWLETMASVQMPATQSEWLMGGLDPTLKAARLANYLVTLRKELLQLAQACGKVHPALLGLDQFEIVDGFASRSAREVFVYEEGWGLPTRKERAAVEAIMRGERPSTV